MSDRHLFRSAILGSTLLLGVTVAHVAVAAPLSVVSYDMMNGGGQASSGTYNYWDALYNGSGATTTDGAALSGGTGKLTDGVVATQIWSAVSNNAGTGEYVGWRAPLQNNPIITFHFAAVSTINSVTISYDDSGIGGVGAPTQVLIDGVVVAPTSVVALSQYARQATYDLAPAVESTLTLQLVQQSVLPWTFVSEVSFDGTPGEVIPEPATLALLGAGLLGLGIGRRRARR